MLQDCGHAGHKENNGADAHKYDREIFLMTLTPNSNCTGGWRLHSIKTRAHSSTFARREINERVIGGDGCGRPDSLVMSLGKHALYTSWIDCTKRTPAEFCSGVGDKIEALNLHYVSDVADARQVVKSISDFKDVDANTFIGDDWNQSIFHPEQWGKLRGLPNPGNVENDRSCPYGADWDASLCYESCKGGYKGAATTCWECCPDRFRDDGAYCAKPKSYGRGAGYTSRGKCERETNKSCEKSGLLYYPKCNEGFKAAGCCVCSPQCPGGMTDIGVSCHKQSYDRGVGVLP
ncbi:MAG: hypothetical protein Fur006_08410 [Coleofasciculaceae cyanobacterium]